MRSFLLIALLATASAVLVKPICQDLVLPMGLPCEDHYVTTQDGFILDIIRIPSSGPPVIVQHGLLSCGADTLLNLRNQSLSFILADAGYDVWISNSRGNDFSNEQVAPKSPAQLWEAVDFDLMAKYDLTSLFAYVRKARNVKKVPYIGHSQGTTMMFAALAQDYEQLSQQVSVFVALAPVAYVHHQGQPFLNILAKLGLPELFYRFGQYRFFPDSELIHDLGVDCAHNPACLNLLTLLMGLPAHADPDRLGFYTNWIPAGTSVHNMAHWIQHVNNERFGMFDWGPEGNLARYGKLTPPHYNLSAITVPTGLFSGSKDFLADPTDVQKLRETLPKEIIVADDVEPEYGHLDFVIGTDANVKIFPTVLALLKRYPPQ